MNAGAVALQPIPKRWHCPNCNHRDVTIEARPHTRFHPCAGLGGVVAPMIEQGQDALDVAALPPAAAVATPAETATAGFEAPGPAPSVATSAEVATATLAALDVTARLLAAAEAASVEFGALDATVSISPAAELATVGFGALDATVSAGKTAPAEVATFGFGAFDARVSIRPSAEFATVGFAALDAEAQTQLPRSNDFVITGPVLALTTGLATPQTFVRLARGPSRVGSPTLALHIATLRRATTTGDAQS